MKAPGTFPHLALPSFTPWGGIQQSEVLMHGLSADGTLVPVLWQIHTAGHGGTHVHEVLAARFLNGLPDICHRYGGNRFWFEEDFESNVPLFIFYNGLDPACWLLREGRVYPREKMIDEIRQRMPQAAYAVRRLAATFDAALAATSAPLRSPLEVDVPA